MILPYAGPGSQRSTNLPPPQETPNDFQELPLRWRILNASILAGNFFLLIAGGILNLHAYSTLTERELVPSGVAFGYSFIGALPLDCISACTPLTRGHQANEASATWKLFLGRILLDFLNMTINASAFTFCLLNFIRDENIQNSYLLLSAMACFITPAIAKIFLIARDLYLCKLHHGDYTDIERAAPLPSPGVVPVSP